MSEVSLTVNNLVFKIEQRNEPMPAFVQISGNTASIAGYMTAKQLDSLGDVFKAMAFKISAGKPRS